MGSLIKKFIVMTSVFPPTLAVRKFTELEDWQLVVVGDKKTPRDWEYPNAIYLSPERQAELGYACTELTPVNHYSRKNIGYLYAIEHGADLIADTDDDNIPLPNWPGAELSEWCNIRAVGGPQFLNVYKYFSDAHVWPRGFPLEYVSRPEVPDLRPPAQRRVGVWQFLANKDPDVDAVYRLTSNAQINFEREVAFTLDPHTYAPFNSQNTVWHRSVFSFMFLPAFVSFRFTDILRGYIAQRCLWLFELHLAFGPATVYQERNPHDFLADFESEIPCYLSVRRLVRALERLSDSDLGENPLGRCYSALAEEGIVTTDELTLCDSWLKDVGRLINRAK